VRTLYTCQPNGSWLKSVSLGNKGPCAGYGYGETYITPPPYTTNVPAPNAPPAPTIMEVMKAANGGRVPTDIIEYGDRYVFKALGGTVTIMKVPGEDSGVSGALQMIDPNELQKVLGLTPNVLLQVEQPKLVTTPITQTTTDTVGTATPYPPTVTPTTLTTTPTTPTTTTPTTTTPTTTLTPTTTQTPQTSEPPTTPTNQQAYTGAPITQETATVQETIAATSIGSMPLIVGAAAAVVLGVLLLKK